MAACLEFCFFSLGQMAGETTDPNESGACCSVNLLGRAVEPQTLPSDRKVRLIELGLVDHVLIIGLLMPASLTRHLLDAHKFPVCRAGNFRRSGAATLELQALKSGLWRREQLNFPVSSLFNREIGCRRRVRSRLAPPPLSLSLARTLRPRAQEYRNWRATSPVTAPETRADAAGQGHQPAFSLVGPEVAKFGRGWLR